MLAPVSSDEKDEGGIVLGGIGFGVPKEKGAPSQVTARGAAPELGEHLLPLRVLVVADLVPSDEHNAGASAPDEPLRVDVAHFDELFKRITPRAALEIGSVMDPPRKVRIDFAPAGMKSFRPDSLVRELPLLRSLLDGKRTLERLRDGTMDLEGARSELSRLWSGAALVDKVLGGVEIKTKPAAASRQPGRDADVSRILDMVDVPGSRSDGSSARTPQKSGLLDDFIAAITTSKPGARPDAAIALVDKALSLQLGAILAHPEMRRLEEVWRGLSFLASRTPKLGVRLEVVSARPEQSVEALTRSLRAAAGIEPPVSVAIVDVTVDGSAASLARYRALAEVGEAFAVPVVLNAGPGLLGRDDLGDVDRLDNHKALFEAPERAPWRSEAHRPASLWACLALNRVLGRLPYDTRSSRVREAQVEELPGGDAAAVWMRPAWAIGSLITRSFEKTGWPCRITGAKGGGIVENLPVREVGYGGSERVAIPTEVFFSTETQKALARLGLCALASQPNSDEAYLLTAATAYVTPPKRTYDDSTAEPENRLPQTPLGDQLFVARVVQFLRALGGRIGADEDPAAVKQLLEAALYELFAGAAAPPGPEIVIEVERGDDGMQAQVSLRPRRFLGVQMEEIHLGVPLG
jgi:type VI secretion system ImpC/EvpB family protein/type VI secretion system ImpB/VipA family protein